MAKMRGKVIQSRKILENLSKKKQSEWIAQDEHWVLSTEL